MGFRFRKSIKIAPGVKLNLNKNSTSVTFGGKGAKYTVNSSGKKTVSVGVPGTGVYYSESVGDSKKSDELVSVSAAEKPRKKKWWLWLIPVILLGCCALPSGDEPDSTLPDEPSYSASQSFEEDTNNIEETIVSEPEPLPDAKPEPTLNPNPEPEPAPEPEPTPEPEPAPEPPIEEAPAETVVYVTETGTKYHLGSCRHLKTSKIEISLSRAVKNYEPCGTCNPPTA